MPLPLFGQHEAALTDRHFTFSPSILVTATPTDPTARFTLSDRLLSMDLSASKNNAASEGRFVFDRGTGTDSLSAAVSDSVWRAGDGRPALDPGMVIHVGAVINGVGCGELWLGRIDRVRNISGGKVEVQCRDYAAFALNSVLRYSSVVSSADTILNAIKGIFGQAFDQGSSYNLSTQIVEPEPTGWMINPYVQEPMTTMEACRRLVQTFGGDFRVRGREGWDKLCILNPGRAVLARSGQAGDIFGFNAVTDATIGPDRYTDITELTWGDEDVRNQWEGYYADPTTGLPIGPIYVEDVDSIARYGPRFARIFLDRASNIDTDDEMLAFLTAALADTKDPFASHKITLPIYPHVELDDLHTYEANGDEYDQNIQLAVVEYTHHWESTPGSMPTTTISARGTPIGAYREYRRSLAPTTLLATAAPTDDNWAPVGTVVMVTDALT